MQINPDFNASVYTIKSYDVGVVTVFEPISMEKAKLAHESGETPVPNAIELTQSAILNNTTLIDNWTQSTAENILPVDYEKILELRPELVLLGTGKSIHFPNAKDLLILQQNGIGVEVMGTAAACRTYNFLVSDGRNVAAALFMIEN